MLALKLPLILLLPAPLLGKQSPLVSVLEPRPAGAGVSGEVHGDEHKLRAGSGLEPPQAR